MEKLIITVAPTGSQTTRKHTPYVPLTSEEIADSIYESWKAGAAIGHVHVKDIMGGNTLDLNVYREVINRVREKCDIILNLTTAGGIQATEVERLRVCELNPEMVSFDAGSINLGSGVFLNTPSFLEKLATETKNRNIKPEIEVFDEGMIYNALRLAKKGLMEGPLHFQFVLGTEGGAPATPKKLIQLVECLPEGSTWSAIGASRHQLTINTMSILLGGHVRVGMEDSVYYRRGELATSNAQFVKRISDLANTLGREVATPDEAREILQLSSKKDKVYEDKL